MSSDQPLADGANVCRCAGDICRQLAKVAATLVGTLAPTTTASSSRSSRTPSPQQLASQAQAWQATSELLVTMLYAVQGVSAWAGLGLHANALEPKTYCSMPP
jgi:hypothetical protein